MALSPNDQKTVFGDSPLILNCHSERSEESPCLETKTPPLRAAFHVFPKIVTTAATIFYGHGGSDDLGRDPYHPRVWKGRRVGGDESSVDDPEVEKETRRHQKRGDDRENQENPEI